MNSAKSQYNYSEMKLLGHRVSANGIQPHDDAVRLPATDDSEGFTLVLGNGAQYLMRRLQAIILTNKKNDHTPLKWREEAARAFDAMLLAHPDERAELILNASDKAIGEGECT